MDLNGDTVTLKDIITSYTIIYFYPKDNTPGCTKEACGFQNYYDKLFKLGIKIVGISKDTPKSHQKFALRYGLKFELLSDISHKLHEAFGVWQEKRFMGRTYMGALRSSFILNSKGEIIKEYNEVDPEKHPLEVYNFILNLLNNKND